MQDSITTFKAFMADDSAWDMFIDGPAGTGKTTDCGTIVQWCMDHDVEYLVCAFTHKACDVLAEKLPAGAKITTLHSYLNKRPVINQGAIDTKQLQQNRQTGIPEKPRLLIVDEKSMVGERDFMDIRANQDEDYDGECELKVLWLGDPHQLPAVGDTPAVKPYGPYQVRLTENKRRGAFNPLSIPIDALISYIEGTATPTALVANERFIRGKDLVNEYLADAEESKVILCYTNKAVQELNAKVAGKTSPDKGDRLFCPTSQCWVTFLRKIPANCVDYIDLAYGERLSLGSKYRTLEYVLKNEMYDFYEVEDEEGEIKVQAVAFGHYTYKVLKDSLGLAATATNKEIELNFKGYKASVWAAANDQHKLARARSKAWRDFLTFSECVVCMDFPFAMTTYKSQGSTFNHVYVDTNDIGQLVQSNWTLYLKMMYVALSRAAIKVITN